MRQHLGGDDQLAALLLGQRLEPARGVDGACRSPSRDAVSAWPMLAQHQRAPRRSPCRSRSGTPISPAISRLRLSSAEVDVARRAQRLPASGRLAVAAAEDGHQAVAQILVDAAAVALDGLADLARTAG